MDLNDAVSKHRDLFGQPPTVIAQAPGRVNIIGEHVDYNGGRVLPFAVDRRIVATAGSGPSGLVSVYSAALQAEARFAVDVSGPGEPGAWENYVRGMVYQLRRSGASIQGARLWIGGDLPPGGGMSSSAALCVATGMALASLADFEIDCEQLARLAQAAEHEFAGTPCGMMDQMAVSFGRQDNALLLDCRDLSFDYVPCRPSGARFLVIPSGVHHALADGAYKERVRSCRQAVTKIGEACPNVQRLSDVSMDMLTESAKQMDSQTFRRARHVVTEMTRVRQAVHALRSADWRRLGALLWQTQDSLRDDYEVSCDEIDDLISLLRRDSGVLGARMVGGGFGGIVLAIVESDHVERVERAVLSEYYQPRRIDVRPFAVAPSNGASVLNRW